MTERDYELLHRFLDGEMTPAEQQEFERSLAQNSELDGMRRELEDMGHMLRSHIKNELEEVDFTHFFAGIEAQLGAAVATSTPAQVVQPTIVRQDNTSQAVFRAGYSILGTGSSWCGGYGSDCFVCR